jgi:hypothetical protein
MRCHACASPDVMRSIPDVMLHYAEMAMTESLRQWVVRGVEDELARQFVDRAARQRRTTGELLNEVLRAYLERPEGQGGAPLGPGDVADLAAQLAAVIERVERLEAAIPGLSSGDGGKDRVPAGIPGWQGPLGSPLDAVEPAGGAEVPEKTEAHPGASGANGEVFATGGDGARRRLTKLGIAEATRMIQAGDADVDIARRLGVERGAIRQRRLKLKGESAKAEAEQGQQHLSIK